MGKTFKDYESLSRVEKLVLFLHTFVPGDYSSRSMAKLAERPAHLDDSIEILTAIEKLEKTGWLRKCNKKTNASMLKAKLNREILEDFRVRADNEGWWPLEQELRSFAQANRSSVSIAMVDFVIALTDLLRRFFYGSPDAPSITLASVMNGKKAKNLYMAVAAAAYYISDDDPVYSDSHWALALQEVYSFWLTLLFVHGRSILPLMTYLHEQLAKGRRFPTSLAQNYTAMCLWCGWNMPDETIVARGTDYWIQGFLHASKGDFLKADKFLAYAHGDQSMNKDGARYDDFAMRLMATMICIAAKPERLPKTRPMSLLRSRMEIQMPYYRIRSTGNIWSNEYNELIRNISISSEDAWRRIISEPDKYLEACAHLKDMYVSQILLMAIACRNVVFGRDQLLDVIRSVADKAEVIAQRGYLNLAGMILSLTCGSYDPQEHAVLLATLKKDGLEFFQVKEPEPEWKVVTNFLNKALPKFHEDDDTPSNLRIVWHVEIGKRNLCCDDYRIIDVTPAVRNAVDSQNSGLYDEEINPSTNDFRKYIDIMSERDIALVRLLRISNKYYGTDWHDYIDILIGMPNLELFKRKRSHGLLTFVRGKCDMSTATRDDGGITLKIPEWMMNGCPEKFLRKVDEHKYEYIVVDRAVEKVADVFRQYCKDGELTIPHDGIPSFAPVMERLQHVMPLADKNVSVTDALPRVNAQSECIVRLDYSNGVLKAEGVVKPVAGNPNLTFTPGVGQAEKMIVGDANTCILVRDLEAEKQSFNQVKSALSDYEEWFDGRSQWELSDIEEAIGALSKLKSSEPAIKLEWFEDRRLKVASTTPSGIKLASSRTAEDWFRVEGEFKLDDGRVMRLVDIIEAMANSGGGDYVRLSDGDYLSLTKTMAKELQALKAAGRRKGEGLEFVKAAIPMLDKAIGTKDDSLSLPGEFAVEAKEIRSALSKKPKVPSTLNAELRPYQREGFEWLSRLASCGLGACLADDMGLGKTVQIISLLLERANDGQSLVIAPSSVCGNWRNEIRRFAPTLEPVMAMDPGTDISKCEKRSVVIASYGYLLFHEKEFKAIDWNGVILDEAQAIKNDASKRAHAVKRLKSKFRVTATGTPVENRLGELWSLFDFLNPGLLGPATSFLSRLTNNGMATKDLKRMVKPLILRRLKGDVLDDLPEKTEITLPVELGTTERTAYEACRRHALAALEKAEDKGEANRISILAELTRLRRFCCHPSLVLKKHDTPSAKMEALLGLLEGLKSAGHRALIFSQFTDYLAIVRHQIEIRNWTYCYLDGSTPTLEREKLVNAFQGGEGDFFLISLKAGGTGLNLTAANYVILLDPWWNPAVENQAADRAHRIGQKNPVTVYRLIASDTVEERVIELHKEKIAVAEDVLEGTGSSSLTPAELMKLFA